jgi:transcriptional regulator with XRE-family HTH domain
MSDTKKERVKVTAKVRISRAYKIARGQFGESQSTFGQMLGCSYTQVSKIENGYAWPTFEINDRFADITGVDPYVYAWSLANGDTNNLADLVRAQLANVLKQRAAIHKSKRGNA